MGRMSDDSPARGEGRIRVAFPFEPRDFDGGFRYSGVRRSAESGLTTGGQDVSTRSGDRQPSYRDLRERTKRQERGREENLKRIVEQRRERHLHTFQSRDLEIDIEALD